MSTQRFRRVHCCVDRTGAVDYAVKILGRMDRRGDAAEADRNCQRQQGIEWYQSV